MDQRNFLAGEKARERARAYKVLIGVVTRSRSRGRRKLAGAFLRIEFLRGNRDYAPPRAFMPSRDPLFVLRFREFCLFVCCVCQKKINVQQFVIIKRVNSYFIQDNEYMLLYRVSLVT